MLPSTVVRFVVESAAHDIAIVGAACRLPGAPDMQAFAELLAAGQDRTVLGAVALGLAAQIDGAGGLGVAPLAKELRATMNAALGVADSPNPGLVDPLDELRRRRHYILRHKGPRP